MNLSLEKVPQGYDWLLRSDSERGYFCHLSKKGVLFLIGHDLPEGNSFKCYAATPEAALQEVIDQWTEHAARQYGSTMSQAST